MRYLLFGGECYYSAPGSDQIIDSNDNALLLYEKGVKMLAKSDIEWFEIYDVIVGAPYCNIVGDEGEPHMTSHRK